jgi:hypothetical protein
MGVALMLMAGCSTNLPVKVPGLTKLGQASGIKPSEEEQIAAVLEDVCRGMQARRIYKVLAHVSPNYHDGEGRNYAALEAYLNDIFKRYRNIRITRVPPRIVVQGDRARVVETFGTVAEPWDPATEPPIDLQGQVAVDLEKVPGDWQIVEWGSLL